MIFRIPFRYPLPFSSIDNFHRLFLWVNLLVLFRFSTFQWHFLSSYYCFTTDESSKDTDPLCFICRELYLLWSCRGLVRQPVDPFHPFQLMSLHQMQKGGLVKILMMKDPEFLGTVGNKDRRFMIQHATSLFKFWKNFLLSPNLHEKQLHNYFVKIITMVLVRQR